MARERLVSEASAADGDALELSGNGAWQEIGHRGRNNTI